MRTSDANSAFTETRVDDRRKGTEMEKNHEMTRTGRALRKARFAAGATGAALLAAFASTAVVYGTDGEVAVLPWWV
jgi:hypothetical protein